MESCTEFLSIRGFLTRFGHLLNFSFFFIMTRRPPRSPLFPYPPLSRSPLFRAAVPPPRSLAAGGGGRFSPPAGPRAFRSVAVLEARDPHLDPVLAAEGERDALGVELFPAVFVVGVRRIRLCFRELRLTRLHVAVDADRGGEEIAADARARGG